MPSITIRSPPVKKRWQPVEKLEAIDKVGTWLQILQEIFAAVKQLFHLRIVQFHPPSKDRTHDHRIDKLLIGNVPLVRLIQVVVQQLLGLELLVRFKLVRLPRIQDLMHDLPQRPPPVAIRHEDHARVPGQSLLGHRVFRTGGVYRSALLQEVGDHARRVQEDPGVAAELTGEPAHFCKDLTGYKEKKREGRSRGKKKKKSKKEGNVYISPYCLAFSLAHLPCWKTGAWKVFPKNGTPRTRGGSLYFRFHRYF